MKEGSIIFISWCSDGTMVVFHGTLWYSHYFLHNNPPMVILDIYFQANCNLHRAHAYQTQFLEVHA